MTLQDPQTLTLSYEGYMVIDRNNEPHQFNPKRIRAAIDKCFKGYEHQTTLSNKDLTELVVMKVLSQYRHVYLIPLEKIQDLVEEVLVQERELAALHRYQAYRAKRAEERARREVPAEVKAVFEESAKYFPTPIQQFQYYDKYARYNPELGRRETWIETVDRVMLELRALSENKLPEIDYQEIREAILNQQVMPSMRLMAMAGRGLNQIGYYNCAFLPVDNIYGFVEAMIISMAGCGVGYSVERENIQKLPFVPFQKKEKHGFIFHLNGLANEEGGYAPLMETSVYQDIDSDGTRFFKVVIADSAEGWAEALHAALQIWFSGYDCQFDYSRIRPAGAPLKRKGGQASGPEPLQRTLDRIREIVLARQGMMLRSIDAHDIMCLVGNAAVSGGVRRTAMISLFDWDDELMMSSKAPGFDVENSQRWNANNSVVWPERELSMLEVFNQFHKMFNAENGEPGIVSRRAMYGTMPKRREQYYLDEHGDAHQIKFGTNPCVTGDTWVQTEFGPRQVRELVGVQHRTAVNGQLYRTTEDGFWKTGTKQILRLITKEGYELRLTDNHKVQVVDYQSRKVQNLSWEVAANLTPGDVIKLHNHAGLTWDSFGTEEEGWLLGHLIGNGTFGNNKAYLDFWGEEGFEMAKSASSLVAAGGNTVYTNRNNTNGRMRMGSNYLTALAESYGIGQGNKVITDMVERSSSDFHAGFLRGLFDADGTVCGDLLKGASVRLNQSNLDTLKRAQRMLLRLGIASTIYQNRYKEGLRELPDGKGGTALYPVKANHDLCISGANLQVFAERIGFSKTDKAEKLAGILADYKRKPNKEWFTATIVDIKYDGVEDVYDCSVPGPNAFDANGIVAHNCGEIILRPFQFCNLSAVVARAEDKAVDLAMKVRIATIIGTIQSKAVDFKYLRPIWRKNCEEERLLGVDITGQLDSPASQIPHYKRGLRQLAVEVNKEYAEILGIPQSAAVTCVKPSGNTSQLVNCSSGLHARWSEYYFRHVRLQKGPMLKVLQAAGVPLFKENGQEDLPDHAVTQWVARFPVKSPEDAITKDDRSALRQMDYWLQNKLYWTEHNPSVTITYKPEELADIVEWVWTNQEHIGGMAFLPAVADKAYRLLPYVSITEEEYNEAMRQFPENVDFSVLYGVEYTDLSKAAQELSCMSGQCEV